MIRELLTLRLSRRQFGVLVALSALACVAIIATAGGHQAGSGTELVALLDRAPIIHHLPAATPAPAAASSSNSGGSSGLASTSGGNQTSGGSGSAAAVTTSSTPVTDDGGGSSTDTGATTTPTNTGTTGTTGAVANTQYAGKVKHVFVIALTTSSAGSAFGHKSAARYLNGTLVPKGTLLSGYRTLGGSELPDYLAMVSGQAPNTDTRENCPVYDDFPAKAKPNAAGEVPDSGCVYPNTVITLGDQVTASAHTWGAYLDDMGRSTCIHPNSGAHDDALLTFAGPQYDTRHNPFIYFHSLLDLGDCSTDDTDLSMLPKALHQSAAKAPRFSFIAPGLCDDAASASCPAGQPGGIAAEDAFLKAWVPKILASPAYKDHGVLMIVFAASHAPGAHTGASAAVLSGATGSTGATAAVGATGATAGAGATGTSGTSGASGASGTTGPVFTPLATAASATPERTGLLIISSYAHAHRVVKGSFNPYSVLLSIEDLFGYTPLAHAAQASAFISQALPGV